MSKKFRHLDLSPHWQQYFSKYPQGYTIIENLIDWVSQVDDMVDNQNELNETVETYGNRLDEFIGQYDTHLQETVEQTLSDWQTSGFLEVVINEALNTKYHEMDERLTAQLAEKADLTQLSTKLDKGKVTRAEIDRSSDDHLFDISDFNEQSRGVFQGLEPGDVNAVLGEGNVQSEHIADDAVTFDKRTRIGSNVHFMSSENRDVRAIKIDMENDTLTIPAGLRLLIGKDRFEIDTDKILDLLEGNGALAQALLFDTVTEEFSLRTSGSLWYMDQEERVVVGVISFDSNSRNEVTFVDFGTLEVYVDDDPFLNFDDSNFRKNDVYTGEQLLLSLSTNINYPNLNTNANTFTLYSGTGLMFRGDRILLSDDIVLDLYSGIASLVQVIVYDIERERFRVILGSEYGWRVYDDTLVVAVVNYSDNNQSELRNIYCSLPVTVNGKRIDNVGNNENAISGTTERDFYYISSDDLTEHYTPTETLGYNAFVDKSPETVNQLFSELTSEYGDYIQRDYLGKDQSDTHEMYKYSLVPPKTDVNWNPYNKTRPKIVLLGGLHGSETSSIYATYYFLKDLCENWETNSVLEYLRWNVEFYVIPLVNPWGFENGARANSRNVDINRNFGTDSFTPGEVETSWGTIISAGESEFSEKETQYIRDLLLENEDAFHLCDFHTNNSTGEEYERLIWIPVNNDSNRSKDYYTKESAIGVINKMTREFKKRYDVPETVDMAGYLTTSGDTGATARNYGNMLEIESVTLECFRKFPYESEYETENTIKASTEILGNWFANLIKPFQ